VSNDQGWEQGALAIVPRMEIRLQVFFFVRRRVAAFGAAYRVSKPNFGATARQIGKENLSLCALLARKQQIPIAWPESVHASPRGVGLYEGIETRSVRYRT
jgi:hypothetical protein